MPSVNKIVESGLHPVPSEQKVLEYADEIGMALITLVRESVLKIKEAERAAVARLEEYVPTEPLLDRKQASAYLKLKLRQFDLLSAPNNAQIPYIKIGGAKRFRKRSLDGWLDSIEVRKKRERL